MVTTDSGLSRTRVLVPRLTAPFSQEREQLAAAARRAVGPDRSFELSEWEVRSGTYACPELLCVVDRPWWAFVRPLLRAFCDRVYVALRDVTPGGVRVRVVCGRGVANAHGSRT